MSYHKIILIGNLGRDPEMRYTANGTPVTNLSVATTEKWTGQDGQQQERTIWWRVSVWGKQAETVNQYLAKGRQVLVEGRINADSETGGPRLYTRNDGTPGASYEVTAFTVRFLGGRTDTDTFDTPSDDEVPPEADIEEDSIPF
jgi:single-strand DNA-binding protein